MSRSAKTRLDNRIIASALSLWQYKRCSLLLSYIAMDDEINTNKIIKCALRDGKHVAAPRCRPGTYIIDFYLIFSLEELVPGPFGLLEPLPEPSRKVTDFNGSICFVPGLCFDLRGHRLGYGKGYYDRFLADYTGYSIGLCHSSAVLRHLPTGPDDRRVDALITDENIRYLIE